MRHMVCGRKDRKQLVEYSIVRGHGRGVAAVMEHVQTVQSAGDLVTGRVPALGWSVNGVKAARWRAIHTPTEEGAPWLFDAGQELEGGPLQRSGDGLQGQHVTRPCVFVEVTWVGCRCRW